MFINGWGSLTMFTPRCTTSYDGQKCFFFQKELHNKLAWVWGCRLHEGCLMPLAWFWLALARVVQDVLCHLHGFGPVVVTIVQDALCLLHGFGQSWPELCRMSYAICMVLASRAWRDILCHLYGFGQSWLEL